MNHTKRKNTLTSMLICALFTALIAVGAFIRIPIPTVPFTLQFLFTNLAGILLGSRRGAISVGVYLVLGLIGIPIFTAGGGPGYIFQPTFGYLIGFLVGTFLTGKTVERSDKPSFGRILGASFAGLGVIYLLGLIYYYFIMTYYLDSPIGLWALLLYGCFMTLPGDIFICFASSLLCRRLIPALKRSNIK